MKQNENKNCSESREAYLQKKWLQFRETEEFNKLKLQKHSKNVKKKEVEFGKVD